MGIIMKNGICYSTGGDTTIQPVIYSDTEREVGVWSDGKPLYQKTFSGYVNIASTSRTWTVIRTSQELSALNIDTAFIADGTYLIDSNDNTIYLSPIITGRDAGIGIIFGVAITDTGALAIVTDNMTSGSNYCSITIQYTKTTDTPGSGTWTPSGVPAVHYSTDEQVIGTWINGKTLYQKTLTYNSSILLNDSSWTTIPFTGVPSMDYCVVTSMATDCIFDNRVRLKVDNGDIKGATSQESGQTVNSITVTVQYTKASS